MSSLTVTARRLMRGHRCSALLQAIIGHPGFKKLRALAGTQLFLCKAQQLANIIWAFATLDVTPEPAFMEALAEEAVRKHLGFNPQNVANMLWAFAKLDYMPACPLVPTLAKEALKKLPEFVSQNVSNMLWAFARFNFSPGPELLESAVRVITSGMRTFNPQVPPSPQRRMQQSHHRRLATVPAQ